MSEPTQKIKSQTHRRLIGPWCQRLSLSALRRAITGSQEHAPTPRLPSRLHWTAALSSSQTTASKHSQGRLGRNPRTGLEADPEEREREGRKRKKDETREGRRKGRAKENKTQVHPEWTEYSTPLYNPLTWATVAAAHCSRLSFPAQLLTHTHAPVSYSSREEPVGRWTHMNRTDLHSSIWPTKVYRTVEKNQKGRKRKTRIKKTDELILRRTNRNRPQQTKHLNYHAKSFLYNQQQNGPLWAMKRSKN